MAFSWRGRSPRASAPAPVSPAAHSVPPAVRGAPRALRRSCDAASDVYWPSSQRLPTHSQPRPSHSQPREGGATPSSAWRRGCRTNPGSPGVSRPTPHEDAVVLDLGRPAVPQNFIECDREQELLLPPSLREWLADDHLAWFVADAVEEMDLAAFYGAYRSDGWGRAAFEPKTMVALLLYAYAVGERSSRGIERRCREDVAFRVLCANRAPDHATIARFRARHEQALADGFEQVPALCAKAGLVSVGLVALDGSLIAGDASQRATRSYAAIRSEVERSSQKLPRPMPARTQSWAIDVATSSGRTLQPALAPRAAASLQRGARGRAGPAASFLRGEPRLAGRLGGRARSQAWRAQADATRPRCARQAQDQHHRSRHPASKARRRALGPELQRPGRRELRAGDRRRRHHPAVQRLGPARADGRKAPARRCAGPGSRSRSPPCWPTAATGTLPRSLRFASRGSTW